MRPLRREVGAVDQRDGQVFLRLVRAVGRVGDRTPRLRGTLLHEIDAEDVARALKVHGEREDLDRVPSLDPPLLMVS